MVGGYTNDGGEGHRNREDFDSISKRPQNHKRCTRYFMSFNLVIGPMWIWRPSIHLLGDLLLRL
jgi:hypothetical protein